MKDNVDIDIYIDKYRVLVIAIIKKKASIIKQKYFSMKVFNSDNWRKILDKEDFLLWGDISEKNKQLIEDNEAR